MSGPCRINQCVESSPGLQRIPCMPRERGDKIISRDPKWAVLWRCWKKPFSGAAANSVQVQIIYLDPRWEERQTLMSDQVGRSVGDRSLSATSARCLLRRAHGARCHILSLSCSPPDTSPVSEFKMAALCTSVIFLWLCTPPPPPQPPLGVGVFSGWVWFWCPLGPRSSGEMQTLFCCSAGRAAELMHKMRPHRGDSIIGCLCVCVYHHQQQHQQQHYHTGCI